MSSGNITCHSIKKHFTYTVANLFLNTAVLRYQIKLNRQQDV